jgi:hypothetical protein
MPQGAKGCGEACPFQGMMDGRCIMHGRDNAARQSGEGKGKGIVLGSKCFGLLHVSCVGTLPAGEVWLCKFILSGHPLSAFPLVIFLSIVV